MLSVRSWRSAFASISGRAWICQSCQLRLQRGPINASALYRLSRPRNLSTEASPQEEAVHFRKQLKDEAKKRKAEKKAQGGKKGSEMDSRLQKWELTVGIEIHAELNTAKKLFSGAATSINHTPNSHVALFDVAFPGTQPCFQQETLIPALRAAIALQCEIQTKSSFDRKHYFYQDQPAGYQITQYYEPFARDGSITLYDHDGIAPEDGKSITIGIKQVQMEQDTAKTLQQPPSTHLLDFNRVSHPLIEIITLPQIHHPATAAALVRKIQAMLKSVDAVTAGMEMGGLRADVNVSVKQRHLGTDDPSATNAYYGVTNLGQRTEIKNLSTFKAIEDAIVAERDRQIDVLEAGGAIEGETRGWTLGGKATTRLRGKEGEVDYRYMPDPDLGPVIISPSLVSHLRKSLPSLPDQTLEFLTQAQEYGLSLNDAKTLSAMDDGDRLDYYMDVVDRMHVMASSEEQNELNLGRAAGNWILMELGGLFSTNDAVWDRLAVPAPQLASLILLSLRRKITGRVAKQLLASLFEQGGTETRDVEQIVREEGLELTPMTGEEYAKLADEVMDENPQIVQTIREGVAAGGKAEAKARGKVMWLVGQMVRGGAEGRVEAKKAEETLNRMLR
ncbi:Asp-tRNAAsn/Glu-tRNAGln amidotransferase B subunit [Saccharata proteae CBS 121410]|uniref:Glutamyl-tRNA(Gln) amidotransferase subunit B, mitochondrial n=1 Tax=Saccharata proteae CBS 121410 TaxID=1314787 RepID=A0A9P4HY73_9PEZI|nr:Asp-tRNAAsn/Glu-tRNAGln amidotransferase B subunit [Saccharata proteae CBS 121410]